MVDNKIRRHNIAARIYSQAETTLNILEADSFQTLKRSEGNAEYPARLDFITSAERRTLLWTVQVALKTTHEIEARDNDNGMTAGKPMLEKLAEKPGAMPVVDSHEGDSEPQTAALPTGQ